MLGSFTCDQAKFSNIEETITNVEVWKAAVSYSVLAAQARYISLPISIHTLHMKERNIANLVFIVVLSFSCQLFVVSLLSTTVSDAETPSKSPPW